MRTITKILLSIIGSILLIQSPDFETKTVYVEEVDKDIYLLVGEEGSETVQIIQEEEDSWQTKDMK